MDKNVAWVYLAALSILLFTALVPVAQLGEIAGQPHFNVSLGGSETINITIINQGNAPLPFRIVLPTLTTIPNTTTPIVTATPLNSSIPPHSNSKISVTVHMPEGKNRPGLTWTGILQIVELSTNSTSSGGASASVVEGVAKIVTITSTAHVFSIWDIVPYAIVIIVIVAVVVGVWHYRRRKMPRASKAAPASRSAVVSSRVKGKKTKRRTSPKKRKGRKATRRKSGGARKRRRARR